MVHRVNVVDDLTPQQRFNLNQLILDYLVSEVNPNFDPNDPNPLNSWVEYKYTIVGEHTQWGDQVQTGINHSNEELLSWHREYIAGLEQYLFEDSQNSFPCLIGTLFNLSHLSFLINLYLNIMMESTHL